MTKLIAILNTEIGGSTLPGFHTDEFLASEKWMKAYPKRILLVRDPRDVCLSWVNFIEKGVAKDAKDFIDKNILGLPEKDKAIWRKLSKDQQLSSVVRGNSRYSQELGVHPTLIYYPLGAYEAAVTLASHPNTLICKFENLVGPKGGGTTKAQKEEILKIVHFLDLEISEDQLNHIASRLFGGTGTFHKGQVGKWKTAFNKKNKNMALDNFRRDFPLKYLKFYHINFHFCS